MPASLVIPTIFTAVDRLSTVVSRMGQNVNTFAGKASAGLSRLNNKINSLIPGYNSVKGALMGFVGAAVLAGLIVSGIVFSARSLIDYEKNIAALRIVLNDISTKDFKLYQDQIDLVAKSTRTSAVEVAAAAAKIAELNIHLASTPQGLADVTKATVVFARAANMEMAPAAEGLVSIMSQFGLQADQANRTINVLAAGLKYGSASIENQVESYKNFGTVAKTANITLEQSTALVQTLAKYQLKGAEAGTALRGAIIRLQKAGAGYASGQFNINDALDQANKKYQSLATARQKDAFLIALFGIRQITAGKLLLNNVDLINKLTKEVTGTNEAFKQSDIRMDTVAGRLEQLKAGWVNYLTSNENARKGMKRLKDLIVYVTDNLDTIIDTVISFVKWFTIIKTTLWIAQKAFWIFSIAQSAFATSTAAATAAVSAQTVVVTGFGGAIAGVTTEFTVAQAAAQSFFATLEAFVIPAAILTLGSFALWKAFQENQKMQDYGKHLQDPKFFNPKDPRALNSPFSNSAEEIAYQKWYTNMLSSFKGDPFREELQRPSFVKQFGFEFPDASKDIKNILEPAKPVLSFTGHNVNTNNTLDININDPKGSVDSTTMRGPVHIPVKMTSTTGNK